MVYIHFLDLGVESSGTLIELLGHYAHQAKTVYEPGSYHPYQAQPKTAFAPLPIYDIVRRLNKCEDNPFIKKVQYRL